MNPYIKTHKVSDQVVKKHKPKNYKRESILAKARKKAHSSIADCKRTISNELRPNE